MHSTALIPSTFKQSSVFMLLRQAVGVVVQRAPQAFKGDVTTAAGFFTKLETEPYSLSETVSEAVSRLACAYTALPSPDVNNELQCMLRWQAEGTNERARTCALCWAVGIFPMNSVLHVAMELLCADNAPTHIHEPTKLLEPGEFTRKTASDVEAGAIQASELRRGWPEAWARMKEQNAAVQGACSAITAVRPPAPEAVRCENARVPRGVHVGQYGYASCSDVAAPTTPGPIPGLPGPIPGLPGPIPALPGPIPGNCTEDEIINRWLVYTETPEQDDSFLGALCSLISASCEIKSCQGVCFRNAQGWSSLTRLHTEIRPVVLLAVYPSLHTPLNDCRECEQLDGKACTRLHTRKNDAFSRSCESGNR
jgi:Proteasome stabiliser